MFAECRFYNASECERRIGRVVLALWRHVDVAIAVGRDGTHVVAECERRIGRVVLALWRHVDVAIAIGRDGTHVVDVAIRLDARQLAVLVARAHHSVVAGLGRHRGNRSGLGFAPADEEDDERHDGKKQERPNDGANDQRRVVRGSGRHRDDVGDG